VQTQTPSFPFPLILFPLQFLLTELKWVEERGWEKKVIRIGRNREERKGNKEIINKKKKQAIE